jgi:hypothetical protein
MERFAVSKMLLLLCLLVTSNLERQGPKVSSKTALCTIKGKVFRSDSNKAISNSYILLRQEKDSASQVEHFDVRTDENGEYLFKDIPAGSYTVSIYAWFPNKIVVPCQNLIEGKTVDGGNVTVEWQRKSRAFMEIVTIKGFSPDPDHLSVKDFDLLCK